MDFGLFADVLWCTFNRDNWKADLLVVHHPLFLVRAVVVAEQMAEPVRGEVQKLRVQALLCLPLCGRDADHDIAE